MSHQRLKSNDALGRDRVAQQGVVIPVGTVHLLGYLASPEPSCGLVLFAHGSASSRHSSRNRLVADVLNRAGYSTLLFDLLTREEAIDRANVFDIALLAHRLAEVAVWQGDQPEVEDSPIAYFGASTGAAAALWTVAESGTDVAAVVSRGGRPDLAESKLPAVTAPTLLIVGELDHQVVALNRKAQASLRCENRLSIVTGATHLFQEPGALEHVAELAVAWLKSHLGER